jgi:hypothetical protein
MGGFGDLFDLLANLLGGLDFGSLLDLIFSLLSGVGGAA